MMVDTRRSGFSSPESRDARDSLDYSGFLHKRRGGFGKYALAGLAWQERFVTISKLGLLTYYEGDPYDTSNDDVKEKPRGRIDLRTVDYEFLKDIRSEGAPTLYCMQICPPNEEKWVLCASTKEDYTLWCHALEKYVKEKGVFVPGPSGLLPLNYASDDEGYRSSGALSYRSGASSPETVKRPKSYSDPKNPNSSILSIIRRASYRSLPSQDNLLKNKTEINIKHVTLKSGVTVGNNLGKQKKRLKAATAAISFYYIDSLEWLITLIIMNFCYYMTYNSTSFSMIILYILIGNFVVARTLILRNLRIPDKHLNSIANSLAIENENNANINNNNNGRNIDENNSQIKDSNPAAETLDPDQESVAASNAQQHCIHPAAGSTFTEALTTQRNSPEHTWCKADHRQFIVRVGPEYARFKKKAPSSSPIFEPFAVDVFCTKTRIDHATKRFTLPDTSHIETNSIHVPPIFVIQIQIPADPPPSFFTAVEDGPGWAILMYYRISEDACNQLKDLKTASPAVKLFAQWCEKAPTDAAWRGRFKVINSCTNLEELGMPQAITSYNAKPVLIRRTGTIFKGPNYLEMDIHVHKFANIAKQSIHLITSRCKLMAMQIGFVIEGRENNELPETLFACIAVNKPQEDLAEFLFDDNEDEN